MRNNSNQSGLYFHGDQTYFEFFEENQGDRLLGDAGVEGLHLFTMQYAPARRAVWRLRP